MRLHMNGLVMVGAMLVACAGSLAVAQIAPPATPANPQPSAPLSGPTVANAPGRLTLVHTSMDSGLIMRLETTPEEEALELVGLTPEEKAATDKIFAERAKVMDKIVAEHLPLLLKFQGYRENDTTKERMQALTELFRAMQPMTDYSNEHGKPLQLIAAVIPAEKMATVQKLVTEYNSALANEAEATVKTKENQPDKRPAALRGRETLLHVGNEVKRSYERQIAAKEAALNDLVTRVNASPAQEERLRKLAAAYAKQTAGKPTAAQRRELFERIMKELDDEQKLLLLRELFGDK